MGLDKLILINYIIYRNKQRGNKMAQQKLITAEVKKFLKKHPSGSQDGLQGEAKVACRLFCPFTHALTWYILEGYEGYAIGNKQYA